MALIVPRLQPEKYEDWLDGKDVGCHPEVPEKPSVAPRPSMEESYGLLFANGFPDEIPNQPNTLADGSSSRTAATHSDVRQHPQQQQPAKQKNKQGQVYSFTGTHSSEFGFDFFFSHRVHAIQVW